MAQTTKTLLSIESRLAAAWPPQEWGEVTVLAAVSGGADSVAMLRAMCAVSAEGPGQLVVGHFDHRLRGTQSAEDAHFVVGLCRDLQLICEQGHSSSPGDEPRDDEQSARRVRYQFLRETAERLGARYVVTAHTADDQAETVLHHIVRGTGLSGLRGISRVRSLGPATTLIRPLLDFRRQELLNYLAELGQAYRTDPTNDDLRYTRNRIRHKLLPQLAAGYNDKVVQSLCRLGSLAGDAQQVIQERAAELAERSQLGCEDERLEIDVTALAGEHPHLVREALIALWRDQRWGRQQMTYADWDLLARFVLANVEHETIADRQFPGGVTAQRRGDRLHLARRL